MRQIFSNLTETQTHLSLPLIEGLPALEDEGNSVPPLIADVEHGGGEGRACGALRDGLVVKVSKPGVRVVAVRIPHVLA